MCCHNCHRFWECTFKDEIQAMTVRDTLDDYMGYCNNTVFYVAGRYEKEFRVSPLICEGCSSCKHWRRDEDVAEKELTEKYKSGECTLWDNTGDVYRH